MRLRARGYHPDGNQDEGILDVNHVMPRPQRIKPARGERVDGRLGRRRCKPIAEIAIVLRNKNVRRLDE